MGIRKIVPGALVGSLVASPVWAISADQQAAVTAAFESGETSVGLVVSGVILIAGAVTALGLIYKWLAR